MARKRNSKRRNHRRHFIVICTVVVALVAAFASGTAAQSTSNDERIAEFAQALPVMQPATFTAIGGDLLGWQIWQEHSDCFRQNLGNPVGIDLCKSQSMTYIAELAAHICMAITIACRAYNETYAIQLADGTANDDNIFWGLFKFFLKVAYEMFDTCFGGLDYDEDSTEMYIRNDEAETLVRIFTCGVAAVMTWRAFKAVLNYLKWMEGPGGSRSTPSTYSPYGELYMNNVNNDRSVALGLGMIDGLRSAVIADQGLMATMSCLQVGAMSDHGYDVC